MDNLYDRYQELEKRYLQKINALSDDLSHSTLTDNDLRKKASALKRRISQQLHERYASLTDLNTDLLANSEDLMLEYLPEAFALARVASGRLLGMYHFDEQIIAGIALHLGNIAELKNGEGKTIVALLTAYLNALFVSAEFEIKSASDKNFRKRNVHVMTSNDYLARRDYIWLKPVYEFLSVTVGYLQEIHSNGSPYSMGSIERKIMYAADIVYGSSHEFIFDFLRDNNAEDLKDQVQGGYYLAIADEADHILLDEAQTPHILSGTSPVSPGEDIELIYLTNCLVNNLYHNPSLVNVDNHGTLYVSWTGREVLRVVGQKILKEANTSGTASFSFNVEDLIGLVFQLIEIIGSQKEGELDPLIIEEIAFISQWSKSLCDFYQLDAEHNLSGFSREGEERLTEYLTYFLTLLPEEKLLIRKVIIWLIKMMTFVLKNTQYLQNILVELKMTFGITSDDLMQVRPNIRSIFKSILASLRKEQGDLALVAQWIIGLINDYIVDIARISFSNSQLFHSYLQNILVFINGLLAIQGKANLPYAINDSIQQLQNRLLGKEFTPEAAYNWAPVAFVGAVEAALLPVVLNMLNPHVPAGKKDTVTALLIIGLRVLREAFQLQRPTNDIEREILRLYEELGQIVSNRVYEVFPERESAVLTRWGQILVEDYAEKIVMAGLWSGGFAESSTSNQKEQLKLKLRFLTQKCLSAYFFHRRDNEYVVQDNPQPYRDVFTGEIIDKDIVIIGELTGRMMPARRWQQWLHAFLEAKEGLPVKSENETRGRITTQSYISFYPKRSGMTATAHIGSLSIWQVVLRRMFKAIYDLSALVRRQRGVTIETVSTLDPVETELENVYQMKVLLVPTHSPLQRVDWYDAVFNSVEAKLKAVVELALERHAAGQPVLIETVSVEQSKTVARLLQEYAQALEMQVTIQLLHALTHEREAEIISKAGVIGALTVSTQLAGRGTDIVISKEALQEDKGGLFVIGVERLKSRRWDDQVKGRAGRQGEIGASKFFVSYNDELMTVLGNRAFVDILRSKGILTDDIVIDEDGETPSIMLKMVTDFILATQVILEHIARQRREMTAALDKILGESRNILIGMRQETLKESYTCPKCARPEMRVLVQDKAFFCSACLETLQEHGIKLPDDLPKWRLHFEKLVEVSVDSCIRKDTLEQYLVDTYTSDAVGPKDWNWDDLVKALSQRLTKPTYRKKLTRNIDFGNELFPQTERQKLIRNIKAVLLEDFQRSLAARAEEIIDDIHKNYKKYYKTPRYWRFDVFNKLARSLNGELFLSIDPAVMKQDLLESEFQTDLGCILTIKKFVNRAIEVYVSTYDWVTSQGSTIEQLLNLFNPLIQSSAEKLTRSEVEQCIREDSEAMQVYGLSVKKRVLNRLASSYNSLIERFDKGTVFEYENEVLRSEIDKNWSKLLQESDIIVDELRGWTNEERVIDYGVRVAKLFQQIQADIARETLQKVLQGEAALIKKALNGKPDLVRKMLQKESGPAREVLQSEPDLLQKVLLKEPELVQNLLQEKSGVGGQRQLVKFKPRRSARISGESSCVCGGGKSFAQCCGNPLYQGNSLN